MYSRRRRAHGGYMIQVPSTPPTIDISNEVDTKITFINNFNSEVLTQYGIIIDSQYLGTVYSNQSKSPVWHILDYLYGDNTLRDIYFTGTAIQFISITSGITSEVVDKAIIQADTINISYLQNEDYLIDHKLVVDSTAYQSYVTYMYPIPAPQTGFNVFNLKSQTKVNTYNSDELIYTDYFTGDLSYNHAWINGQYYIQVDTVGQIDEVFPKYCITYDNVTHKLLKFKRMTISPTSTIVTDNLDDVTF